MYRFTYKDKVSGETLHVKVDFQGDRTYYKDADMTIIHREDGPAIQPKNAGSKFWFSNNVYHRLDGPAIEYKYGAKFWFVNGIRITQTSLQSELDRLKTSQ